MHADLLVLAPDRPDVALVVEVQDVISTDYEAQLKRYMLGRQCPVALIVTPTKTRLYRDTYADFSEESIELAAELDTTALLSLPRTPAPGRDLERAVFDWLERLSASWSSALPASPPARAAVVEHLVPAVAEGRVMFGKAA